MEGFWVGTGRWIVITDSGGVMLSVRIIFVVYLYMPDTISGD